MTAHAATPTQPSTYGSDSGRARLPDASGFAVSSDGVRLAYDVYGTGEPTIAFLPSTPIVHARQWKAQIPYLSRHFRVVAYDQPRGCAAAYYPETNPLVPLEHTAEGSNQPASKSVIVRLEKADGSRTGYLHASDANRILPPDRGDERKRQVQPHQMS